MKKFLCLMMSLVLVLTTATAFAAVEYSLLEKWQRQVDFGNGVKGTLTVDVSGEADWAKLLAPLNGTPLQIRAIHADENFQYRIYAEDGEELLGLTQLYGSGDAIYLKSDLLPDTLLTLATGGDWMDRVMSKGENPSLHSAVMNILNVPQTSWESKWQPALSAYEAAIELWLENYASAPSVKRGEDGSATVLVRYDIPADAVKAQIKALWGNVLQDATLLPLLRTQMNEAQQAAYLNEHLKYHYDKVIDSLALNGNVVLEREMTAKGEAVRTDMTFPLDTEGYTNLQVKQLGTTTTVALTGAERSLELEMAETASLGGSVSYQGKMRVIPADSTQKGVAAAFTLVEIKSSSTDEDTRSHDITNWMLKLEQDADYTGDGWTSFEPVEINAKVHLHSKAMQNMPTTMEVELGVKRPDAELAAVLSLKTSSPWVLDDLPVEGAVDVATLTEEQRAQIFTDLGMNGLTILLMLNQEAVPVVEATTTDLAAIPLPETTATDLEAAQ
ncbi:MAG: hypothetical protein IJX84_01290 [Clostridia bacterium]|nr:hypothetical protein [Clostridia bacterium]